VATTFGGACTDSESGLRRADAGDCTWAGTSWSCAGTSISGAGGSASVGGADGGGSGGAGATRQDASSIDADGSVPVGSDAGAGGSDAAGNRIQGPAIIITEFLIPTASQPGAVTTGPDGNIWFLHESTAPSALGRCTTSGSGFAVINTAVTNTGPIGIVGGPDGNVWFTKQGGIGRVMPPGTVSEFGLPNGGDSGGLAVGPDGNLWFTQPLHNKITRATTAPAFTDYTVPTPNSGPFAITLGPDKNLWFTEPAATANKIGVVTTSGQFREYPIPTPSSNPRAITGGPDGNVWFTELDGHNVGRITQAGVITEFAIPSVGSPGAITAGPDGNLWFVEAGSVNAIGRITPSGGISEYVIPTASSDPSGITVGPDSNLWFTELSANKIGRISNLTGGGNLQSSTPSAGAPPPLAGTTCASDADCAGSGRACGGDVCSYKVTPHVCVLANTGDPGYCSANAQCWCAGEGAMCNSANHACSFTIHAGP
jgi:streptogramin lyase